MLQTATIIVLNLHLILKYSHFEKWWNNKKNIVRQLLNIGLQACCLFWSSIYLDSSLLLFSLCLTQYHQKSYKTFSNIESELRKLPNLTQYHQKSYMTFSDIKSQQRKLPNLTQYHQKSYMTFSNIESEFGNLPNLTQYHQKSYMTFSDIKSELRKLPNLTQ